MAGAQQSSLFSDFNLPHGDSDAEMDEVQMQPQNANQGPPDKTKQAQQVADMPMGVSDDEGDSAPWNRTYAGAQFRKADKDPDTDSPERGEDQPSPGLGAQKPRPLSLFGGGNGSRFDEDTDDEHVVPKTPGQGIGMSMNSLSLETDEEDYPGFEDPATDNGEGPSRSYSQDATGLDLPYQDALHALSGIGNNDGGAEYAHERETPAQAYSLRQHFNRTAVPTAWIDFDKSGNYDPAAETLEKAARLQKAKSKKKGKQKAEPKEFKPKMIIKLPFENMGNVLNITCDEEHWSDGYSIIDSEDERAMKERRALFRFNTPGVEPQEPISDPKGELHDLTGHPAARGCTECRQLGQDCSAIADGLFPCEQCESDDAECLPITTKSVYSRGRCDACTLRSTLCSFEGEGIGTVCDQCIHSGYPNCSTSSQTGYTRKRTDLNIIMYGPGRKHSACTFCRANRKRCSLKSTTDKPPCKHCKRRNIGCTFYDVQTMGQNKASKGKGKKKADQADDFGSSKKKGKRPVSDDFLPGPGLFDPDDWADLLAQDGKVYEREDTPEVEMEDAHGRTGMVAKIRTSFAHPIKFYAMGEDAPDCNFCEMPAFGFVGHFEKTVAVLRWYSGLGFTEIGGGHSEENHETTMCKACTFARLQIIACPAHVMRPVDHANYTQDFSSAADEILRAEPRSAEMQHQLQRWCSMCFSLARYKCCAPQPSILDQDDAQPLSLSGCGLRLCQRCEKKLREVFEGDLDHMAAAYDQEHKPAVGKKEECGEEEGSIRADVGFLKSDGLLMLNVQAS